jgi:hypothetical protein
MKTAPIAMNAMTKTMAIVSNTLNRLGESGVGSGPGECPIVTAGGAS